MIRALIEAYRALAEPPKASRQKKDALFELATRICAIAEQSRTASSALSRAAAKEKRKALKVGLELLASGVDAEGIGPAFAAACPPPREDPGAYLEWLVVRSALLGMAAYEHYSVIMHRMAAYLGPEYFDKADAWLEERAKRRKNRGESLVIPGDLPDVIRALALDRRDLELAFRAVSRDIAAAALAGCPQENADIVKPLYGRIGAAALEDDAAFLRSRLSGDEIAQAQAALLEVVRGLDERGEVALRTRDELSADPGFVAALTRAILGLEGPAIKAACRASEGALLAAAMQGMEPAAHDKILGSITKKDMKRVLDAIDDTDPLPREAVERAGMELAARLAQAAAATTAPKAALEALAAVRDWR